MDVPQTTPPEAHATLVQHPGAVYLDVRTEEEFEAGHPAPAHNLPVFLFDPATRRPSLNPDFLSLVERTFPKDTKLLVGCQSGARSQQASMMLLQAGYTDVTNVQGSFGGTFDAAGRLVVPGWRDAGLPVETGQPAGRSYAALRAKT